ncbi:translocon-associated protein subunit delta isoform X1 [Dermacentor andersoni]|uniref:translocon-associated protein delta n=1 Tax=Dermacentor variabilis TaxID=34621 RepID=UPI00215581EB|nr:translocon-associated protein subunit delta-like isoform X1 [Dermacentor andersoni]
MAALRCVVAAFLLGFLEFSYGKVCENPEVTPKVYTTTDGLVIANIAFIAEFHLRCRENVQNVPLYADVKGKIVPVVKSTETNDYQVSWTEELSKAQSGDYLIRVYDEEGYGALRKAQRTGESTQGVTPLFTINVNHPGTYRGQWVQSEFVAVMAAALLWYFAYSAKAKLQS